MARLAEIYRQELKTGGGFGSAVGKRLGEKLDPRQIFDRSGVIATMFPALKSYSATKAIKGKTTPTTPTPSLSLDTSSFSDISAASKMTAKNTMILPAMARDMNLMRQNIAKIVKLQGGTAAVKADMFFKRAGERESLFESAFAKMIKKPTATSYVSGGKKTRDGQTKETALFVESIGGLSDTLLGALGGAATAAGAGKLSGFLAKALPFVLRASLPVLGITGLASLLYFLIKKDSGEAQTIDEMKESGGYTPEQRAVAAPAVEPATEQELKKVRESMRTSEDPDVRAAAAELDRRDAIKALPDESEAERRRLGLSERTPQPAPSFEAPPPMSEPIPANVVTSESGAPIRTGFGGYVTSGTEPTPVSTTPGKVSDELVENVKRLEGFQSKAFWDHKQYSIGYGTKANSPDEVIDRAEAERRLRTELEKSQKTVVDFAKKHNYAWSQKQIDSLTSFIYNLGPGALNQVTSGGKRTNEEIAKKIPEYNKASGSVSAGLVKRRNVEFAMFTGGAEGVRVSPQIASSQPTSGTLVASASSSISDAKMEMLKPSSGSVIVDNSQRNTVAQSGSSGKLASAYDRDLIEAMVSTVYL